MATDLQRYKQKMANAVKLGHLSQKQYNSLVSTATGLANKNGDMGAKDLEILRKAGSPSGRPPKTPVTTPTKPPEVTTPVQPVPVVNAPKPTTPPGDGMYWSPVTGPDGNITAWQPVAIPGYTPPAPAGPAPGMSGQEKAGAKQRLKQLLLSYGLISQADFDDNKGLWKTVDELITEWGGNNDSVIMSYLRESDSYKTRFKGNDKRIGSGYSVLSEAEYVAYEDQIKKKMRGFGLDGAFYSSERLADLIGYDVSGDEVADRLTKAKRIIDSADPNIKDSLVSLYGASMGDLVGYVLDPALAAEGLQRKINAGIAYGVAQGNDLQLDRSLSEQIGELTYGDERTARQALGQAGDLAKNVRKLKNMDQDIDITDADVVEQQFGLDDEAGRKVRTLQSRERARFGGSSGAFSGTLSSNKL